MNQSGNTVPNAIGDPSSVRDILADLAQRQVKIEESVGEIRRILESQQIEKEWYSTSEVSEIMGVKQYTVQERWCNQGRIECAKDDNGKWRIPGHEVRRLRRGEGLGPASSN